VPALFLIFVLGSIAATVVQRPVESGVGLATLVVGFAAYRWQRAEAARRTDGTRAQNKRRTG
jgi:hypothetical protein